MDNNDVQATIDRINLVGQVVVGDCIGDGINYSVRELATTAAGLSFGALFLQSLSLPSFPGIIIALIGATGTGIVLGNRVGFFINERIKLMKQPPHQFQHIPLLKKSLYEQILFHNPKTNLLKTMNKEIVKFNYILDMIEDLDKETKIFTEGPLSREPIDKAIEGFLVITSSFNFPNVNQKINSDDESFETIFESLEEIELIITVLYVRAKELVSTPPIS